MIGIRTAKVERSREKIEEEMSLRRDEMM